MRDYYKYLLKLKKPESPFTYRSPYFTSHNNIFPPKDSLSMNSHIQTNNYLHQIDKPQSFSFHNNNTNNNNNHSYSSPLPFHKLIPRDHRILHNCFVQNENINDSSFEGNSHCEHSNQRNIMYSNNMNNSIISPNEKIKENSEDNKGFVVVYQDDDSIKKENALTNKNDLSFNNDNRVNKDVYFNYFPTNNNNAYKGYPNNLNYYTNSLLNKYKAIGNYNEQQHQQVSNSNNNSICKLDNIFGVYNNIIDKNNLFSNIIVNSNQPTNKKLSPITPISQASLRTPVSSFINKKRNIKIKNNSTSNNTSFSNNNNNNNNNTSTNNDYVLFKTASIDIFEMYSNKKKSISSLSHIITSVNNNNEDINNHSSAHKPKQISGDSPQLSNKSVSINHKFILNNGSNNGESGLMSSNILDKKIKKLHIKKRRKYKPDDIRKKIKARFHKTLKNRTNEILERAGCKILFDFLPQSFICDISRDKNNKILQLTYRELLQKDFSKDIHNKYKKIQIDKTKYNNNQEVLKYLEIHENIKQKSGFNVIGNLIYIDILKEYFKSEDFVDSVRKLEGKEDEHYIQEYVNNAKEYINFFLGKKKMKSSN